MEMIWFAVSGLLSKLFNFKLVVFGEFLESDENKQHIFDVFFYVESISDRIMGVRQHYLLFSRGFMNFYPFFYTVSPGGDISHQLGNVAHTATTSAREWETGSYDIDFF